MGKDLSDVVSAGPENGEEGVAEGAIQHDVEGMIGAGRYERGEGGQTYRNGDRDRALKTRMVSGAAWRSLSSALMGSL